MLVLWCFPMLFLSVMAGTLKLGPRLLELQLYAVMKFLSFNLGFVYLVSILSASGAFLPWADACEMRLEVSRRLLSSG